MAAYCRHSGGAPSADVALLREFFDHRAKPGDAISAIKIGKSLRALAGSPFLANGDRTIKLGGGGDNKHAKIRGYKIERKYPNGA